MITGIIIAVLLVALAASFVKIIKLSQDLQAEKHNTARSKAWSEIVNDFPVLDSPVADNSGLEKAHKPKTKKKTTSTKKSSKSKS